MGIQSTRFISRKRAEEMWVEKMLESYRNTFERLANGLDNNEIEDSIESTFDNYSITDEVSNGTI